MSNFQGYLLSFNGANLNNKYISLKSFKVTPNQRLEIEAYRDADSLLHRVTSPNFKTKIDFTTVAGLTLSDKEDMFNTINTGLINSNKKSYNIVYWNDDTSSYRQGKFYMPNVEYPIRRISDTDIIYEPIRIAFIEY